MNIEELHILLEETGVSNIHYCLCGGLPDEKLCIEEKKNNGKCTIANEGTGKIRTYLIQKAKRVIIC